MGLRLRKLSNLGPSHPGVNHDAKVLGPPGMPRKVRIIPSDGSAGRKLLDDTRNTWALVEVNARGVRCPRL